MKNTIKFVLVFALAFGFAACGNKNVKEEPSADTGARTGEVTEITVDEAAIVTEDDGYYGVGLISDASVNIAPVYFALDKYTLSGEAKAILDANVEILKVKGINSVIVEGNCDERGTISYNIALGDKRAKEVKDYYVKSGIPARNVTTVSYGEERPVCFDKNESCYARNRRADTVIK
jgi:peptidoglycan-associated lipoprotein